MNLGLSLFSNIKDAYARLTLQNFAAAIGTGYGKQHNANDTHSTITATGSISERARTVAIGVWIPVPYVSTNFSAPTGSTWTVLANNVFAYAYTLVGTTMLVSWYVDGSILAVGAAAYVILTIPGKAIATRQQFGAFSYDDNGTRGTGVCQAVPTGGGTQLRLSKDIRSASTWSVSGNLCVAGHMVLEVSGI